MKLSKVFFKAEGENYVRFEVLKAVIMAHTYYFLRHDTVQSGKLYMHFNGTNILHFQGRRTG
jgi:hypothetical protein